LPLLIGVFGFLALPAVILNTATSLIVVLTALLVAVQSRNQVVVAVRPDRNRLNAG
jgi:hypothetical protein